jgi:hypothetical protein
MAAHGYGTASKSDVDGSSGAAVALAIGILLLLLMMARGGTEYRASTESRDLVPQASPPVEELLRRDPQSVALWERALMEWQMLPRRDSDLVLGAMGMSMLVRERRAPVEDNSLVAALRRVQPLPSTVYVSFAQTALTRNGRSTALAILNEGLLVWPEDSSLQGARASLTKI